MDPLRVVAISGSLRSNSYSRMAAEAALEGAKEAGAQTEFLDLRELDLVFVDTDLEDDELPEGVHTLRQKVHEAQGLILSTPEYHGSYSGVLKNALDLMGFNELEGKMIGLVSVSGGVLGGVSAMHELRTVGRAVHAWVVPEQAAVPRASKAFGPDGDPLDERLKERLHRVGRQVAQFAKLHAEFAGEEFIMAWEKAPENPGG